MTTAAGSEQSAKEGEGELGTSASDIARAAARLFASQGYDATSVREIVEAAGVTKPTLYYHFGSKEGLAQALVSQPLEELKSLMRQRIQDTSDPVEALVEILQAELDFCVEEPDRARFFYAMFFGPLATGLAQLITLCKESLDEISREAVRGVVEAGIVEADRAEAFTTALDGLTTITVADFLYRDRPINSSTARRLVDDLLLGFGRGDRDLLSPSSEGRTIP